MILVDTSVWIANLRGNDTPETKKLHAHVDSGELVIGDIVLLEVLRGARTEAHAARLERDMRAFPVVSLLGPDIAVAAAANDRRLRALGVTIRSVPDLIIATYCIEHGQGLLHADRDFEPMRDHLGLMFA